MKQHYVKSGELDIYVNYNHTADEAGNGKNQETIIFVHGYPDSDITWSYQLEHFKSKANVAAINLRGSNNSSIPAEREDYNIMQHLPDIEAVADFIAGPGKKFHLVAHDWGALISWVYISTRPYSERVKSYTAISCPHPAVVLDNYFKKIKSMEAEKIADILRQFSKSWYIWFYQLPFIPELMWQMAPRANYNLMLKMAEIPESDDMHRATTSHIQRASIHPINLYRELLRGKKVAMPSGIEVPVELIVPLRDLAIDPATYDNAQDFVHKLNKHLIDDNHWVHRTSHKRVNAIIEKAVNC